MCRPGWSTICWVIGRCRYMPITEYITLRAIENFTISGVAISTYPELIFALSCIKEAAALSNADLGLLDRDQADAIVAACREIRSGALGDQFPVDAI